MQTKLSGNQAAAFAMKQINPDVVAAFPITPSTEIPEIFSKYVANGYVDTQFITVESEHSAMSACIGSALSGARTMTATSSNGLAYMFEMLHIAASMRAPVIMNVATRAISGPLNIHNDHSDAIAAINTGWIILFAKNNQEVYDNNVFAVRLAEKLDVQLPIMICQDGFITSHSIENINVIEDNKVQKFIGKYDLNRNLLTQKITAGPLDLPPYLFEHKYSQEQAIKNAYKAFNEISKEYEKISNVKIEMIEQYMVTDAEKVIVVLGSTFETAQEVVDQLRTKGEKVGVLGIRLLNPFPANEIVEALKNVKKIAVLEKVFTYNLNGGIVFQNIITALKINEMNKSQNTDQKIYNYIYGIGGRDVSTKNILEVYETLEQEGEVFRYLGLKGGKSGI